MRLEISIESRFSLRMTTNDSFAVSRRNSGSFC
jgi:hypothetical protein